MFACLLSVSFANICIFCETATGFLSGKCLRAVCGAGVADNFTPSHNRIGLSALCFYGIGPFYASGFRGRGKCSSLQKAKRLLPATRPHFSPARRHILFRAGLSYTIFMALLFLVRRRHYCHLHILLLTVGNTGIFTSLLIVRHLNGISFINLLLSPRHCLHLFLGRVGHNLLRQRHVTH